MLKAHKLTAVDLQQVQSVLEALPSSLLQKGDIKLLIVDAGCYLELLLDLQMILFLGL
jgi:hypothetical protein